MANEGNGDYDWREEMRRNWEDHNPLRVSFAELRASIEMRRDPDLRLHADVQNLLKDPHKLIDRIPPESLR